MIQYLGTIIDMFLINLFQVNDPFLSPHENIGKCFF